MGQFAIGQPVPRTEDPRLLMGAGRYTDDVRFPGEVYVAMVRSPHAHANIESIDVARAKAAPGVLLALTGADIEAAGLGNLPCALLRQKRDGSTMFHPPHPLLLKDRVRTVGDAVAMVVAETLAEAKDAAELVEVDYTPLPAIISTAGATATDAPTVWEECPDNEAFFAELGDRAATDAAFEKADHVVRQRLIINRITANQPEPRGCVAIYDPIGERFTVHCPMSGPHGTRHMLAEGIFHLPDTRVRVIAGNVGGGFGGRSGVYPEIPLVAWAAQLTGRPVRWICERSEAVMTDNHAPRQCHRRRVGAGWRRQVPGSQGQDHRQSGRLPRQPGNHFADHQSGNDRRRLHHACDQRPSLGRLHQFNPDRHLSRRRPA